MENYPLRVAEAIAHYNRNHSKKITQARLGELIEGRAKEAGHEFKSAAHYLSRWNNGQALTKVQPMHIHFICELLEVDANFLLGINEMK